MVQTSEQKPGGLQKIRGHHGGQKEKKQDSRDSLLLSRPSRQFSVYASSTVRDKVAAIKQRDNSDSAPICPLLAALCGSTASPPAGLTETFRSAQQEG